MFMWATSFLSLVLLFPRHAAFSISKFFRFLDFPVNRRLITRHARNDGETAFLNAANQTPLNDTDVLVVGGGIHSLIYAIHTAKLSPGRTINVVEKAGSPSYKIGESTLTTFGLWLKTIGIESPMLWRLFGPKDGLAFYYMPQNGDPENYTGFCANGPPGDFVPTLQIERKISELMLTLIAQRMGVNVWHGHSVDIDNTVLADGGSKVPVAGKQVNAKLVVDATGRFRRFASKEARLQRFDGWNTDAFWGYFECPVDESEIPLDHYESVNTNHICLPEGWAWVIRLPTWEGSSIKNLTKMINYLLDLNYAGVPADEIPSSLELARMFGLKFRWVVSIGFALRTDTEYPADLSSYGSCEAEQRFNWITAKYPKMAGLMSKHKLVRDLYGPGTTWYIRKNLTYVSPKVTGNGFIAIGDATGFTNPLYSPGINANMGTSVAAAELTASYLDSEDAKGRAESMQKYEEYCNGRVDGLHRMNVFNYVLMRSPQLGPLGPLWQYLSGTGMPGWQKMRTYDFNTAGDILKNWDWGAREPEYAEFADSVIKMLPGKPSEPVDPEIEQLILNMSDAKVKELVAGGKFKNRWAGLLRWYNDSLIRSETKIDKDILARRCSKCTNWRLLTGDRKCATCGAMNKQELSEKVMYN